MNWKGNESLKCGVIVHFERVGSRWVEVVRFEGGGGRRGDVCPEIMVFGI